MRIRRMNGTGSWNQEVVEACNKLVADAAVGPSA
jgi:hypothetical protein